MRETDRWHPLPADFRRIAAEQEGSLLLETARQDRESDESLLFFGPLQELAAWTHSDLDQLLREVDAHTASGYFVAGYFTYECGEGFVGLSPSQPERETSDHPLAWLSVYQKPIRFNHRTGEIYGTLPTSPTKNEAASSNCSLYVDGLQITRDVYDAKIARVQQYLAGGHTYQVNFTDRILGSFDGDLLDVYATLLEQQPVSFAACLNRRSGPILSFSPELFYRTSQNRITVRPMKGTWPRGVNSETDRAAKEAFLSDEKTRGEHITIVDLLRNDVGKVCEPGSVHVERLLEVERYATLLQMTSTISGSLRPHLTPSFIFRHLFPSGSITGAPKRRTMEIIRELESGPRGIYTGSIGYFGPNGEACFNVAIRTLNIRDNRFSMGVGGGITADSDAAEEFKECEMKAAFLTKRDRPFSLIETMHCTGDIPLLQVHLRRLADSAAYFEIPYDDTALRIAIDTLIAQDNANTERRIRLELHQSGAWTLTSSALENRSWHGRILLAKQRTTSRNVFLHHKTTNRQLHDQQLARAVERGFDEVLFLNERSHITEGAISNIFFEIDGNCATPALSCGVLPGIMRSVMLAELPAVRESEIQLADLKRANTIWMCNALRGKRAVKLIQDEDGSTLWQAR